MIKIHLNSNVTLKATLTLQCDQVICLRGGGGGEGGGWLVTTGVLQHVFEDLAGIAVNLVWGILRGIEFDLKTIFFYTCSNSKDISS